ncbi:MAG: aminoglycoside phosphotransferase family protein [Chloroflexi bacterium]|nr:aminoglycoside phosphotransferase family protein [Chloroflexota bacterium]
MRLRPFKFGRVGGLDAKCSNGGPRQQRRPKPWAGQVGWRPESPWLTLLSTYRRNPHKPFDPSLIQDLLGGRDVASAELLPAGKSNTNYKLVLSDGEAYVLRLYSHGDSRREAYVMDLVRDLVPVPLEVGHGANWSLFTFLEGDLLERVPESSDLAAQSLARISSVQFQSAGWIEADGSVSPFPWLGVRGYAAEKLETAEVQGWLGPEMVEAVFRVLESEQQRLAELDADTSLVHGDFNPTNILIREGTVGGVLDWEYCHAGTPYMDIGNLLRHTAVKYHGRIKSGLQTAGMYLPKDWRKRAQLADLTSHLEFLTSTRSDAFKRQCVGRVRRFLRAFEG